MLRKIVQFPKGIIKVEKYSHKIQIPWYTLQTEKKLKKIESTSKEAPISLRKDNKGII